MASIVSSSSNLTAGFIDLATYEEMEKFIYPMVEATNYFVRETQASAWFTQIPVVLSRASGQPGFGQEFSVSISRAGDYLLQSWMRLSLPACTVSDAKPLTYISWTPNLMHNIIREVSITFNDLCAAKFDSYHLDFITAFMTPKGKEDGYNQMIGNTPDLTTPAKTLPAKILNLPLPLFYSKDTGVSLPTASLPYNDMRLVFHFSNLADVMTAYDLTFDEEGTLTEAKARAPVVDDFVGAVPEIKNCQVWCNYALVSNESRRAMGSEPRDILIEQSQRAPVASFAPFQNPYASFDIRFSHAIKAFFFGAENRTIQGQKSNYTTQSPLVSFVDGAPVIIHSPGVDPIAELSLIYENTHRLAAMGSDYYSLIQPYYQDKMKIPTETGYHMYSYALDLADPDPTGSTNFGKLTNISLVPVGSTEAQAANEAGEVFNFVCFAINMNVVRIAGGALGFPIL